MRFGLIPLLALLSAGQSVTSTHSGLIYFFDGYVFVGDTQLQSKFGRFPEIGEGVVLRTELGRAEILLTPGVLLRVDENSAIRMISNSLADTRVELLRGSAIIEVGHEANPQDTLVFKTWEVRVPKDSVARIGADPAEVRVLSGTAEVSGVTVQRGELLPLASVLVAEQATTPAEDSFGTWAMNRSSVVSEDNSIAAGITDDPDQLDSSGAALGNFSYFPPTGIPSMGIAYPYGLSFAGLYPPGFYPGSYFPGAFYPYPVYLRAMPMLRPLPIRITGTGLPSRPFGLGSIRTPAPVMRTPAIAVPHVTAPRPIHR